MSPRLTKGSGDPVFSGTSEPLEPPRAPETGSSLHAVGTRSGLMLSPTSSLHTRDPDNFDNFVSSSRITRLLQRAPATAQLLIPYVLLILPQAVLNGNPKASFILATLGLALLGTGAISSGTLGWFGSFPDSAIGAVQACVAAVPLLVLVRFCGIFLRRKNPERSSVITSSTVAGAATKERRR